MTFENPPITPAPASAPAQGPAAAVVVRPRRTSNRLLDMALAGAALLAIGGVAFGVGRATAPAVPAGFDRGAVAFPGGNVVRPNGSFAPGSGRGAFGLNGALSIDGTVTAVTADSMTVKLADGQEMTFALDSSTAYHQASAATSTDVAVGNDVSIKLKGGQRVQAGADASAAPKLPASDVTVTR